MAQSDTITITVEAAGGGLYVVEGASEASSQGFGGRPGFEAGRGQG